MGWARDYNKRAGGKAWEIIGYTGDGVARCIPCAEAKYHAAELSGDVVLDDSPAPIFSVEASSWRDGGDHRSGCGLACDPCGAVVVEACAGCVATIGGAS